MLYVDHEDENAQLVNLRYTTADERRWQTVCDKRDNNFVWTKVPPNFTLILNRFIFQRPEIISLSEDYDKPRKQ